MNRRSLLASLAAASAFFAALAAAAAEPAPPQGEPSAASHTRDEQAQGILLAPRVFRAAVARVQPSLVTLESFGGSGAMRGVIGGIRRPGEGNTTGLVLSADGLVVTSAFNFISRPSVITVVTHDGQRRLARMLGRDDTRQICLLQVETTEPLPVPEWVDPQTLSVGQWAMSVGVGYGDATPALSLGMISAKNRGGGRALQTDANISPANYGGPLIDSQGRVIGICVPLNPNSSDRGAGVEWYDSGIGFAIPLHGLESQLAALREGKNFYPAYLGVSVAASVDARGARVVHVDSLAERRKALVAAEAAARARDEPDDRQTARPLEPIADYDYPAHDAGLRKGDLILSIAGQAVIDTRSLRRELNRYYAGDSIELVYLRDGQEQTVKITLGRPPRSEGVPLPSPPIPAGEPPGPPDTPPPSLRRPP